MTAGSSRVVLVAGGSSGIGLSVVHALLERGDTVAVLSRSDERGQALVARLGPRLLAVPADLVDPTAVEAAVGHVVATFGKLDAAVTTAQVMAYGRVEDVPREAFERVVDVAVHGTANLARSVLPVFRAQNSGTLVVVNSLLGEIAVPGLGAYVTAKWAQLGLVRTLQLETRGDRGVSVSLISPGAVNTPIYAQAASYAGRGGHAPPPVVSPERVAGSVLRVLDRPRRHVEVGPANRITVLGSRFLPWVYDRLVGPLARLVIFRGGSVADSAGNVFEPRPEGEGEHGGWDVVGRRRPRS